MTLSAAPRPVGHAPRAMKGLATRGKAAASIQGNYPAAVGASLVINSASRAPHGRLLQSIHRQRQNRSWKSCHSPAATLRTARAMLGTCLPAEQGQLFVGNP
jgi:hypothetical protein